MTRVFLTIVLPLMLPTALYVLWMVGVGRLHATATGPWRELPWSWLALAGIVLALGILTTVVVLGGMKDGVYVPPRLEHGAIVPGHVERAPGR